MELLRYAAACRRPPHEVVTFGFSRLEWKPREIFEELSPETLTSLAERLEREYAQLAPLPSLHAALFPLRKKVASVLRDVMPDPRTREIYAPLLDRNAGETVLADYYRAGHSPEALIVQWWDKVKRSVFIEIRNAGRGTLFAWSQERMP